MLPNYYQPRFSKKSIIKRQVSVERRDALIRKASNLGRRWTHVLRSTLKILLSHKFLKEKKKYGRGERISVNHQSRRMGSASLSFECRLADSLFIAYLAHVICLQDC